ncbi:hypothetical protein EBT31_10735 [bacterium]|nr:hypothetical protein [bacterium]
MIKVYKEFGVDCLRDSENAGPTAAEMKMAQEIERLRARVEVLEKVREAAQALEGYGFGWLHWDELYEVVRAALKEAKP